MHDEQESDLHLIAAAQNGNKQAFDELVIKYQYRVLKLVTRYVIDKNEASDISQEAFFKAYRALGSFRGDSSFYTWLYRIAVNTAKNYKDRRKPETPMDIIDLEQYVLCHNENKYYATPETNILSNELESMLSVAIEELPQDLRRVIVLREIEGLTYCEISKMVGCPVGTVRSRIFRAREAIKKFKPAEKFVEQNKVKMRNRLG